MRIAESYILNLIVLIVFLPIFGPLPPKKQKTKNGSIFVPPAEKSFPHLLCRLVQVIRWFKSTLQRPANIL